MAIRFTDILRDLIIENARFQILFDKYAKPSKEKKAAISFKTLFKLIAADPTTRVPNGIDPDTVSQKDMDKVKIGKYVQWILKNYIQPDVEFDPNGQAMEDLYTVTSDLMKYERFKNRIPEEFRDINKLTPATLYDQVKDFSLEKTKASKEEKAEASVTYQYPGAEIVYRGSQWTVARIEDKGELGKKAACFYGGNHLEPAKGETRWCTSSPGLTWFERYIAKGPLYVVIPNSPQAFTSSMDVGQSSGLPALRYQFHFPDNQYMDPADHQIDLVDFLNKQEPGLKEYFKPEFMNGLTSKNGKKVTVNYPGDSASKFIALYGFDDFFETLPENIERLEFTKKGGEPLSLVIPDTIGKFKSLTAIHLVGCVSEIPESVCSLEKLQFLSLPENPNLKPLPTCLANLSRLTVLNLKGSNPTTSIPDELRKKMDSDDNFHLFA